MTVAEQRLPDYALERIYERWRSMPNSDGAATWYQRDVGALLDEVIALRRMLVDLATESNGLATDVEQALLVDQNRDRQTRRRGYMSDQPQQEPQRIVMEHTTTVEQPTILRTEKPQPAPPSPQPDPQSQPEVTVTTTVNPPEPEPKPREDQEVIVTKLPTEPIRKPAKG